MAAYNVEVQNVEYNEENVAVTGTVNGRQMAAVVNRASVPGDPSTWNSNSAIRKVLATALAKRLVEAPEEPERPSTTRVEI